MLRGTQVDPIADLDDIELLEHIMMVFDINIHINLHSARSGSANSCVKVFFTLASDYALQLK